MNPHPFSPAQSPPGGLVRLAYFSVAAKRVSQDLLDDLLRVSQERNRASGITGVLLCDGESFVQVLEGPPDAVLETYERIEADSRHRAVVEIQRETAAGERLFPSWSMGFGATDHESVLATLQKAQAVYTQAGQTDNANQVALVLALMKQWPLRRA
jgi:hypothetical protein